MLRLHSMMSPNLRVHFVSIIILGNPVTSVLPSKACHTLSAKLAVLVPATVKSHGLASNLAVCHGRIFLITLLLLHPLWPHITHCLLLSSTVNTLLLMYCMVEYVPASVPHMRMIATNDSFTFIYVQRLEANRGMLSGFNGTHWNESLLGCIV